MKEMQMGTRVEQQRKNIKLPSWIQWIAATAGVLIGLANGLGQWYVLRQRLPRLRGWIMASVLGTTLGTVMSAVLLGLFELPLLRDSPNLSVGAILGIFTGIFQGLFLQSYRRQDK